MDNSVKLIIEIPKDDYEFTKGAETARVFPSEYYVKLILNGMPLEGEYISKAELIKRMLQHINRFAEEKNFSMNEGLKYAQGVIGGMPTVPEREKEASE